MKKTLLTLSLLLCLFTQMQAFVKDSIFVNTGGQKRNMIVFRPNTYESGVPLMIVTHGMNQSPEYQYDSDKFYTMVDTAKFVVAYLRSDGNTWDIGGTKDINFVKASITKLEQDYGIDTNRVYWSGFSMGSMLIYHAIPTMYNKIAAFAPTSGIHFSSQPWNNCPKPISLIHVHAYDDDVFGYTQYGIHDYVEHFAQMDHTKTYKKTTNYYPNGQTWWNGDKEVWSGGDNGTEVELFSYHNGGHWPMDGNHREIWNFCKRFVLDKGLPSISFLKPTTSDEFFAIDTITIEIDAKDPDGTIQSVQLSIDGKVVETFQEEPFIYRWVRPSAGSHTLKAKVTDNDKKTKETTRKITILPPAPLQVLEAAPENHSFDLPVNFSPFTFTFDFPIDCDKATATLSNGTESIALANLSSGMNPVISFSLPENTSLSKGDFKLTLSNITDERIVDAEPFVFEYTFGITEVDIENIDSTSAAQLYKGGFLKTMAEAQALYEGTSLEVDSIYESAQELRDKLKVILDEYATFASTAPSEYEKATDALLKAMNPLATRKTNLENYYAAYNRALEIVNQYADVEEMQTKYAYRRLQSYVTNLYTPSKVVNNDDKMVTATEKLLQYIEQLEPIILGIPSISNETKPSENAFYSLDGIRVSTPTRGIYIRNGKKILKQK